MAKENGWVTFSNGTDQQFKASSPKRADTVAHDILKNLRKKQNDIQRETDGELEIVKIIFGKKGRVIFDAKQVKNRHRKPKEVRKEHQHFHQRRQDQVLVA